MHLFPTCLKEAVRLMIACILGAIVLAMAFCYSVEHAAMLQDLSQPGWYQRGGETHSYEIPEKDLRR